MDDAPPTTEVGLRLTAETVGAVMARVAVFELLFALAVIVALAFAATAAVVTVKVAVVAPAATVTEAGTVAEVLLLESETE